MSCLRLLATWSFRCGIRGNKPLVRTNSRCLGTSLSLLLKNDGRHRDRRDLTRDLPARDEGVAGEQDILQVNVASDKCYRLPDENTPNELFDGIIFSDLPVCHIHCTKNNTIMCLTEASGKHILNRSCGTEGFKNCRKGTTVAAQTTGLAMATRMLKMGLKTVRVCVNGMGPGRMSAVKGMVVGGVNIVSITDTTPYMDRPPRPRAAKSI